MSDTKDSVDNIKIKYFRLNIFFSLPYVFSAPKLENVTQREVRHVLKREAARGLAWPS